MPSTAPSVLVQAVLLAGMGVLLGYLSVQVYRQRSSPGAAWFSGLLAMLAAGLLLVVGLGSWLGFDEQDVWLTALYAVVLLTPIPWIGFVARFTGRGEFLTRRRLSVVSAPLLVGTIVVFLPLLVSRPAPLLQIGVLAVFFYGVMLVFAGGALLIRTTYLYSHLSVSQGVAPAVALVEPWFVLTVAFQPIELSLPVRMAVVTAGTGLVTALLAASVLRLGLLETAAAAGNIGQEVVVEEIDKVVIVTDDAGRIVTINEAAKADLDLQESETLGARLESVLGHTPDTLVGNRTIELYTTSGYRTFEVGVSPLLDQHDEEFGRVVTLSDVTRREIRQGQLQVLNRVLRHNLRNKIDIVYALADTVEAPPDVGQQIRQAADDLLTTSERARELEESMATASVSATTVRLADLVTSTIEDVRGQYPDVRVDQEVPEDLTMRSDPTILEYVLSNLVENAAKHNDAEVPEISVAAEREHSDERRTVEIVVRDNGPGISEHERAVIERGEETALQHGSGLGLWTALWGTRLLGGRLRLEDNQPRGTVARIRLSTATDVTTPGSPAEE
jgi:signal transduction histidine kinase